MDKLCTENKENANEDNQPPKFMLPSISNLPNPSPLTPFQQANNHESAYAILRGSPAQATFQNQNPLNATQPLELSIKQETNISNPKIYLPNPSTAYDPMNTSYTTTSWPTYYSDLYPHQPSRDINSLPGPPYNVSSWFTNDNLSTHDNRQDCECLKSPIPTCSFNPYYNNNRHLPPLTSNFHSIINSSPQSHQLGHNSAFTNLQQRKSNVKDNDQTSKLDSEVPEGDNSLPEIEGIKVQRSSIRFDQPISQESLDISPEETVKNEDYDETPLSTPKAEEGKDKKKGRSNWSRKETRSLITAVKLKHKLLLAAQRNAEKSRIWSDMFSDHCTRYSGRSLKAFKLRWARLVADYNSVHDCIKAGVEPMDFDFYDEMKEIFGDEIVDDEITSSEENPSPVLKRKFYETLEVDQSQSSSIHSPHKLDNNKEIYKLQQSKKIRVDEEVKIVLKEVEDTQRKCKRIIEQLKDINFVKC